MRAPTTQQLYDRTVEHLHTQGKRSAKRNGACMYRGPRHTMCALGCHIPDELYDKGMEGKGIMNLEREHPAVLFVIIGSDPSRKRFDILRLLQNVHDNSENWPANQRKARLTGRMVDILRDVAKNHGLSPKILKTLGY